MRELFIRKLIKMVEASNIDSLEVSSWGRTVRIQKSGHHTNGHSPSAAAAPAPVEVLAATHAVAVTATLDPAVESAPSASSTLSIQSPMVGTFYRASSPDDKPYIQVGDSVQSGQVVCIVEAMKLMNEIEADKDGIIERVLLENGQPVEYGQDLFLIKPA
jgi:acetyl-CoA carboxylase biotin carboxyl carrier protein